MRILSNETIVNISRLNISNAWYSWLILDIWVIRILLYKIPLEKTHIVICYYLSSTDERLEHILNEMVGDRLGKRMYSIGIRFEIYWLAFISADGTQLNHNDPRDE